MSFYRFLAVFHCEKFCVGYGSTFGSTEAHTYSYLVVGWRSGLTQCRTVTEVKHGRARSAVGWVTAQVIDQ